MDNSSIIKVSVIVPVYNAGVHLKSVWVVCPPKR